MIGARIREAREALKLTREELANELEVTVGTVANWEIGQSTPTLEKFCQVVDVLDADPGWMLGFPGRAPDIPPPVPREQLPLRFGDWLTVAEAANLLGFVEKYVRQLAQKGHLVSERAGPELARAHGVERGRIMVYAASVMLFSRGVRGAATLCRGNPEKLKELL